MCPDKDSRVVGDEQISSFPRVELSREILASFRFLSHLLERWRGRAYMNRARERSTLTERPGACPSATTATRGVGSHQQVSRNKRSSIKDQKRPTNGPYVSQLTRFWSQNFTPESSCFRLLCPFYMYKGTRSRSFQRPMSLSTISAVCPQMNIYPWALQKPIHLRTQIDKKINHKRSIKVGHLRLVRTLGHASGVASFILSKRSRGSAVPRGKGLRLHVSPATWHFWGVLVIIAHLNYSLGPKIHLMYIWSKPWRKDGGAPSASQSELWRKRTGEKGRMLLSGSGEQK